jgi:hypothetical protein
MAAQMSGAVPAPDPSFSPAIDVSHELDLLSTAIAMLSSGEATRITLVGLPLEDETLREVDAVVRARGLVMRSTRAEVGCDIVVEAGG